MHDPIRFALDLAAVIAALKAVSADGAPPAFNRARPIQAYDDAARGAIAGARDLIDVERATDIWERALAAPQHQGAPVWVHGDIEGNCLMNNGRLSGIVDWGSACVGDPAVDVQVVWSDLFTEASRAAFFEALEVDDATITRSRGAAIQQACAAMPYYLHSYPLIVERSRHKLAELGVELLAAT
jgi:aminoglycoside phosphotransferase (APT) family kinase protein